MHNKTTVRRMRVVSMSSAYLLLLVSLLVERFCQQVHGWTSATGPQPQLSRRTALLKGLVVASGSMLVAPPAMAAVPSPEEIQKLQKGHARVAYLLQNWDTLTTFCGANAKQNKQVIPTEDGNGGGNSCEKTPLVIQDYLGYKSINDPLYKADKLMLRAVVLADDQDSYLDAVERYREKADMVSLMAYTSSWTGANQGFGVEESLEQTKDDVIVTEKILKEILGYLGLTVLPPSK
mmetsp:Transcript_14215/g.23548  ORF Transcript_14215/g.23548 Transcript_14215/m.23548 type:complete len:235 (-) Transcript_14215:67-771(-)